MVGSWDGMETETVPAGSVVEEVVVVAGMAVVVDEIFPYATRHADDFVLEQMFENEEMVGTEMEACVTIAEIMDGTRVEIDHDVANRLLGYLML